MERGPGRLIRLFIMPTLIYRGQKYLQNKEVTPKQFVQLTYRQSTYETRRKQTKTSQSLLTYRGKTYQK